MSPTTQSPIEPDWSTAPKFGRRDTLIHTLFMLHLICEQPPVIVEIGASRDERPEACNGDGWSTRAWGWFAGQTGSKACTVDIDAAAIEACKRITAEQAAAIEYVVSDSLEFLHKWNVEQRGKIDLLYLDSLDRFVPGSAEHHLAEAEAALPLLADRCLVLIDDTFPSEEQTYEDQNQIPNSQYRVQGKGALAVPFLLNNGFDVEIDSGGQVLLSRGVADVPQPNDEAHRPITQNPIPNTISALLSGRLSAYSHRRWLNMPALVTMGRSYCEFEATAEAQVYLDTVARLCRGTGRRGDGETGRVGNALEIGPTSAYAQAYLARRGVRATGVLLDAGLIERARQSAHWLGVDAEYTVGGLFSQDGHTSPRGTETQRNTNTTAREAAEPLRVENGDTLEPNTDEFLPNTERRTPNAYSVIHHSNIASTLPTPWLLGMLRQQTAMAEWVVFSVDSVFAEQNDELDEIGFRRLTPEMWRELLSDFQIGDLRTYGPTGKERILTVLKGTTLRKGTTAVPADGTTLREGTTLSEGTDRYANGNRTSHANPRVPARSAVPVAEGDSSPANAVSVFPFPFGISLIVHTRNEAHQIIDCIQSADGLADEIIVCDMESNDGTPEVVTQYAAAGMPSLPVSPSPTPPVRILRHPYVPNFDSARNASAMFARYRFLFYLDADERIPPGMAARIRHVLATQGHQFEAMALPFRNMFCGKELNCIYGYKAASIYKNGWFFYNARPHQGARIDGRLAHFPADDPAFALPHMSYLDLSHYIKKMDGYSSTEAANMVPEGRQFHWQEMLARTVQDMVGYEMGGALANDGPHGLLWMLCSGFYRIAQYGKYWQRRFESGQATAPEAAVPASLEEALEFMLAVARQTKPQLDTQSRAETQSRRGDT